MLAEYVPVLVFIVIALVFGAVALTVGFVLGPRHAYAEKDSPYECGFEAFEDARMQFDVRYYLVAILFIIFDLEIAFLFPWEGTKKNESKRQREKRNAHELGAHGRILQALGLGGGCGMASPTLMLRCATRPSYSIFGTLAALLIDPGKQRTKARTASRRNLKGLKGARLSLAPLTRPL